MLRLVPMTETEFLGYSKNSIEHYAQEHVKAGNWHPSDAVLKAQKEFQELLPEGVSSKNQYIFTIEDDQADLKIGMIWFAVRDNGLHRSAFIYDFIIDEQYRKQGYGMQTLIALEIKARVLGIDTISLHVFGHNHAAIALYQKAGYEITNLHMAKKLGIS